MRNPLREICTAGSVRGETSVAMVDLNAHETGNGGQKPREAYSLQVSSTRRCTPFER